MKLSGQKKQQLKRGQTIVAEREYVESESERMRSRKRTHRRHVTSIIVVLLIVAVLGLLTYMGARGVVNDVQKIPEPTTATPSIKAEVVDETGRGQISARMKSYIVQLEQDFRDLGYTVTKVTLPISTVRELYVDLDGEPYYFKINIDRGTAVSAEDAVRMIKYLHEHNLTPSYVDVRVEGKAYYK